MYRAFSFLFLIPAHRPLMINISSPRLGFDNSNKTVVGNRDILSIFGVSIVLKSFLPIALSYLSTMLISSPNIESFDIVVHEPEGY